MYFKGSKVEISKLLCFLSLKVVLILANIADPDEMQHNESFKILISKVKNFIFIHFIHETSFTQE